MATIGLLRNVAGEPAHWGHATVWGDMGPFVFIWRCLRKAFGRALGQVDFLVGVISAAVTVITKYDPLSGSFFEALAADIVLWTLGSVLLIRIVFAPYLVWRDDQHELEALRAASALDPLAHTLEVSADVDDNFLDGGDKLLGTLACKNTGSTPMQVQQVGVLIRVNGAEPISRTGAGQVVRPRHAFHYKYEFGGDPLKTIPGCVRFDISLSYGPVGAAPSRRHSKTIEAHYKREGSVLTAASRTLAETDEAI